MNNLLNMLGGSSRGRGGMSPTMLALLGVLAYRTFKGKGRLADMLGTATGPGAAVGRSPLAGLGGGALLGGLTEVLDRFRQSNPKTPANSWVASGPNEPIASDELERTLGAERVQWLIEQTGMTKDELLAGLASSLPDAIDKLTPEGRIPTESELEQMDDPRSPTRPS
jgi:uncharacterized protein YidB (DUF937 family)